MILISWRYCYVAGGDAWVRDVIVLVCTAAKLMRSTNEWYVYISNN